MESNKQTNFIKRLRNAWNKFNGRTRVFEKIIKLSFTQIKDALMIRDLDFFNEFMVYIEKNDALSKKATPEGYAAFKNELDTVFRNFMIKNSTCKGFFYEKNENGEPIKKNGFYVLKFKRTGLTFYEILNEFRKRSRARVGDTVFLSEDYSYFKKGTEGTILSEYYGRCADNITFMVELIQRSNKEPTTSSEQAPIVGVELDIIPADVLQIEHVRTGALVSVLRTDSEIVAEASDYVLMDRLNKYSEYAISALDKKPVVLSRFSGTTTSSAPTPRDEVKGRIRSRFLKKNVVLIQNKIL